jgi:hypothetical protein
MIGYQYKGFLITFAQFFRIQKDQNEVNWTKATGAVDRTNRNFYCWKDKDYRDFVNNILINLEPFYEKSRTKLLG